MKVIFQQDVRGQGKKGEMKEVSEGYGRNYLLPRGLAVEANKDNLNTLTLKEKARKAQEALRARRGRGSPPPSSRTLSSRCAPRPARTGVFSAASRRRRSWTRCASSTVSPSRRTASWQAEPIKSFGSFEVKCKFRATASTAPCSCSSSKSKSGWKNCSDGGCPGPRKRNRRCSARA